MHFISGGSGPVYHGPARGVLLKPYQDGFNRLEFDNLPKSDLVPRHIARLESSVNANAKADMNWLSEVVDDVQFAIWIWVPVAFDIIASG